MFNVKVSSLPWLIYQSYRLIAACRAGLCFFHHYREPADTAGWERPNNRKYLFNIVVWQVIDDQMLSFWRNVCWSKIHSAWLCHNLYMSFLADHICAPWKKTSGLQCYCALIDLYVWQGTDVITVCFSCCHWQCAQCTLTEVCSFLVQLCSAKCGTTTTCNTWPCQLVRMEVYSIMYHNDEILSPELICSFLCWVQINDQIITGSVFGWRCSAPAVFADCTVREQTKCSASLHSGLIRPELHEDRRHWLQQDLLLIRHPSDTMPGFVSLSS